ncbi:secretin N-terminal domain-containing protein [Sulfuricurvum sp.]|uniref:secretin N-terminal domain-containing protein n=1 Tax=Sulfuricurvum sp. TaxID=2025608 RepID=UPI0026383C4F|nr:secretin N-terminal domain-containing protein [Sulfuricurvum sp.]MDD3596750.1 secretin N-terminal domain-containing protein [Sulfuricurvum sp.]
MKIIVLLLFAFSLFSAPLIPPPNKAVIDKKLALLNDNHKQVSSIDSMSLKDFVHYASQSLGKNILVSGTLSGSIDFVSNKDIKKSEVLNLLLLALELNRYALLDHGSYYAVVPASDLSKYPSLSLSKSVSLKYRVITLKSASASALLDSVKSMLSASGSAFAVPDTNTLILSDHADNLDKIVSVVDKADVSPRSSTSVFRSFHLKNALASSLLESVKSVLSSDNNKTSGLSLSASDSSNDLLAFGDPVLIDKIAPLVEQLDVEQFQVYIQVRIIELNNAKSSQIGMNFGLDGGIVSASDFLTFSANFGGDLSSLDSTITSRLSGSLGNVSQLLSIGAALDLLQSTGVSKTVSDPSVLCLNNKESKVIVGKSISYKTGETTNTTGTQTSLTRSDVGLNLSIKPLVSDKDKLTLSIDAILENILPSTDTNGQPITTKQEVKTDSILHHGETIVLGGFVKQSDSNTDNSIPFLSDLPVFGDFFKHNSVSNFSDTLIVVITPYIVDNSRSLSSLQSDLGLFGKLLQSYKSEVSYVK